MLYEVFEREERRKIQDMSVNASKAEIPQQVEKQY